MPVILHDDGIHKLYVGTAGRGQVRLTVFIVCGCNTASSLLSLLTARQSTTMELTFLGLTGLQRRPTTLKFGS